MYVAIYLSGLSVWHCLPLSLLIMRSYNVVGGPLIDAFTTRNFMYIILPFLLSPNALLTGHVESLVPIMIQATTFGLTLEDFTVALCTAATMTPRSFDVVGTRTSRLSGPPKTPCGCSPGGWRHAAPEVLHGRPLQNTFHNRYRLPTSDVGRSSYRLTGEVQPRSVILAVSCLRACEGF
jgi:hypothetical protein